MAITYMDYRDRGGFYGYKIHLHRPKPHKTIQEYHRFPSRKEEYSDEYKAEFYSRMEARELELKKENKLINEEICFRGKSYQKLRNDLFRTIGMSLHLESRISINTEPQWWRDEDDFYFDTYGPKIMVRRVIDGVYFTERIPILSSKTYVDDYHDAVDALLELWPEFAPYKSKILSAMPTRKEFMRFLSIRFRQCYGDEWLNMLKMK